MGIGFEFIFAIVWVAVIIFSVVNAINKAQVPKTIVKGMKPEEPVRAENYAKPEDFSFEALLQKAFERTSEGQTKEMGSHEGVSKELATTESTQVVYKSKETKVKKQKPSKEVHITTSLPAIKATKPPKPEKPKKESKNEEYKNAVKAPHPLKTFLDNNENARNAFIMGEIFKQKF